MMQRRQFSNHEAVNGLGFGFYERDRGDLRIVGHDGFTLQFHSLLALFLEHDIGLFVSYNSTPGGAVAREELFDAFIDEFFEPDVDVPGTLGAPLARERPRRFLSGDHHHREHLREARRRPRGPRRADRR